ncbi:MAG: mechanosensitive ion channel [Phycisphaerae bacterium]|nr:mechanosensitive ion channel [Saprospiraceae bacterium]
MHSILEYQLFSIGEYTFSVTMLTGLVLVWLFTTLLLRTIRRVINRGGGRLLDLSDKGRRMSLYLIVKYFVWTVALALMLEVVGIHVSVILAGSAALLVGLGLGVQQIFRDIVSGIFLLFEGTIEIGDVLELDGKVGRVEEINLRTSKMLTQDGHTMIVPNHKFITENVLNWTHHDTQPSAFRIQIRVAHEADERQMTKILADAVAAHADVLNSDSERPPQVSLSDFQEKCALYELKFWTHKKFEVEQVQSDLRFAIQQQLREQGIPFPKE